MADLCKHRAIKVEPSDRTRGNCVACGKHFELDIKQYGTPGLSHFREHLLTCDIEAVRRCDAAGIDWTQIADGELTREMGRLLSEITRRLEGK